MKKSLARIALFSALAVTGILVMAACGHGHPGCGSSGGKPVLGGGSPSWFAGPPLAGKNPAQQCCPVCGDGLGSKGPAVPVETICGTRPSFWQKLLRRETAKVIVQACSAPCAQDVRKKPGEYLLVVMRECNGWAPPPAEMQPVVWRKSNASASLLRE